MKIELPEAAETFLRDLALPEDKQTGARNGLVALLELVRCRTRVWAAQEQARRAAQEWPLPITAETFLVCHVTQQLDLATARRDLAALLATVRAAERERLAALLEAEAAHRTGDDPALSSAWDDLLAEELRELAGRVREGAEVAPRFALFGGERWTAHGGWLDFIRFAETLEDALPREGETIRRYGEERPVVWWEVFDLGSLKAVAASIPKREESLRERGLWRLLPPGPPEEGETDG